MSKFCTNCGTKGEEGAKVCTNCGTAFENVAVSANAQSVSQNQNSMPQSTPMPNYGGVPQPAPMPNYGGMPQSTPMPNGNNVPEQKNTTNVVTVPQTEKNQVAPDFSNTSTSESMPNVVNMPPQGSMPNSGNMPPQGTMPNNNASVPNGVTPGFGVPMAGGATATKGNNKKTIAIVCVAVGIVLALIIVAIVIFTSFSGLGYESVIEQKLTAVEELDAEKLAKTYPTFFYEEDYDTFEDFVYDVDEDVMEGIEYAKDTLEDEVGENVKLSYEIEEIDDVSEKKFDNFCAGIEAAHNYDISKIKEIKKADIIVTAKGDDDTYEFDWEDVYLIKDNGDWYILNMDFELSNLGGSGSIMHYDYYDYYEAEVPESSDSDDSDEEDSLY